MVSDSVLKGEIVIVCFDIEGTKDGLSDYVYGEVKLNEASAENFIELKDTNEEMVVNWVKDALGPAGVAYYEGVISERIDSQKSKITSSPLPWVKPEVEDSQPNSLLDQAP